MLLEEFSSNFTIHHAHFINEYRATRCVADAPPIENNPDHGASHPRDSLSQHCDAAGVLRLPFFGLKKSFAPDPFFSTVSDVPSRPCSPDVQHHPGHRTRSGHVHAFLNITERDRWAIAGRRCVSAPQMLPSVITTPATPPIRSWFGCRFVCHVSLPSRRSAVAATMYIYQACLSGGRRYPVTIHRVSDSQSAVSDVGTMLHLHCFCRPRGKKPDKAAKPTRWIDGYSIE